MGTTIIPRMAHPKKTAIHSAQFPPQTITRSPFAMPRDLQLARKAAGHIQDFAISKRFRTISAALPAGALVPTCLKILQKNSAKDSAMAMVLATQSQFRLRRSSLKSSGTPLPGARG